MIYYDQTNIEIHYTEAISKHRFRMTKGDIDIVQQNDIHVILPFSVLRRVVDEFQKNIDFDFFLLAWLISFTLCRAFVYRDMTQVL